LIGKESETTFYSVRLKVKRPASAQPSTMIGRLGALDMNKWQGDFVKRRHDEDDFVQIIPFMDDPPNVLNLPLRDLHELAPQRRRKQALGSMNEGRICGADTETVEGRLWLFSTEMGVWECDDFSDLISVLYNQKHRRLWKQGKRGKRKTSRGLSTHEFFFYNLKFDCQAILRLFDDSTVDSLLMGDKVSVPASPHGSEGITVEVRYLEGKYMELKPINWFIDDRWKVGICKFWDIAQFYDRQRLKTAAEQNGLPPKIERCFDDSILDASRFDDPEYRDFYREDIERYAVHDAVLAGELARLKRQEFIDAGVRFMQPYSVANVAQRALLDTPCCEVDGCDCPHPVPTINEYIENPELRRLLQKALSCYNGGWFECAGSGYLPDCTSVDLASAYPYIMYHLPNTTEGYWVQRDSDELFWEWMDEREPYSLGFAEATILFDEGLPFYPLVRKAASGTLVAPRFVRGWFTADELDEARKWPHSQFIIGEWVRFVENDPTDRPYRAFIDKFYQIKTDHAHDKESVQYRVSKCQLSSIYGKTIQCIDGKIGTLWNPFMASTICGATRARLAQLIRVNDFAAVSVATDGVIFKTDDLKVIPNRPLPACHNLGQWELDGKGELLVVMSGVYSLRDGPETKTVFRGSASYFLRPYGPVKYGGKGGGLFGFVDDHLDDGWFTVTKSQPYTAKEARLRNDYSLINRFRDKPYTIRPKGDSTKRIWSLSVPETFGDLLTKWFESTPHRQVEGVPTMSREWLGVDND